ncbi:MAG: hypothetical protein KAJ29_05535, partial [Alphaproteobacteria bacterium]|nr:hypothetical protein [Alphaproteobacteria bacterium]
MGEISIMAANPEESEDQNPQEEMNAVSEANKVETIYLNTEDGSQVTIPNNEKPEGFNEETMVELSVGGELTRAGHIMSDGAERAGMLTPPNSYDFVEVSKTIFEQGVKEYGSPEAFADFLEENDVPEIGLTSESDPEIREAMVDSVLQSGGDPAVYAATFLNELNEIGSEQKLAMDQKADPQLQEEMNAEPEANEVETIYLNEDGSRITILNNEEPEGFNKEEMFKLSENGETTPVGELVESYEVTQTPITDKSSMEGFMEFAEKSMESEPTGQDSPENPTNAAKEDLSPDISDNPDKTVYLDTRDGAKVTVFDGDKETIKPFLANQYEQAIEKAGGVEALIEQQTTRMEDAGMLPAVIDKETELMQAADGDGQKYADLRFESN